MNTSREQAAHLGQETRVIIQQGFYLLPDGTRVDLAEAITHAQAVTRSYMPGTSVPQPQAKQFSTRIHVRNEPTLEAIQRLIGQGHRVIALNFASARNPGGGWLSGAQAQEESLARASALVACIEQSPMYKLHTHQRDLFYTNSAIYSPDVPVFRNQQGELLKTSYLCSFITSPAVNAKEVLAHRQGTPTAITRTMRERIWRILAIAAVHEHAALVLGAWGCGVFGNDPAVIAALFAEALSSDFAGVFSQIEFAILDAKPERPIITPFEHVFSA